MWAAARLTMQSTAIEYEPYRHPACNDDSIDDCDDCYCCYCAGCEYNDQDVNGWPVCEICGQHQPVDDEPVRD